MDEDAFWALVAESRQESRNNTELASRNARAPWFGEFTTEAHIVVSGAWPPGYDPDGPEELIGERSDLGDWTAVRRRFPRLTAFRRDHPELGAPELR